MKQETKAPHWLNILMQFILPQNWLVAFVVFALVYTVFFLEPNRTPEASREPTLTAEQYDDWRYYEYHDQDEPMPNGAGS